jgi:hypothetical protein
MPELGEESNLADQIPQEANPMFKARFELE